MVLAPSSRARDLLEGRRALQRGIEQEVVAVGPSLPVSRRTNLGLPVAVRANLALALRVGRYDVVHGVEPGLPSLSYLALTTRSHADRRNVLLARATGYPARRSRRDRLRIRVDALLATSEETLLAASERFEGDYRVIPLGVDTSAFRPRRKRNVIALELETAGRSVTRALIQALPDLEAGSCTLLHTKPLAYRPSIPRALRPRVHVRSIRRAQQRAAVLGEAAIFVPAPGGEERLALEAAACAELQSPPRTTCSSSSRTRRAARGPERKAVIVREAQSFDAVAAQLEEIYADLTRKPRQRGGRRG